MTYTIDWNVRLWPPQTIREFIALMRHDGERDQSPEIFRDGAEYILEELEDFLKYDWASQLGTPNEGDCFPVRTTPPRVE
jgi:hypothetical protein